MIAKTFAFHKPSAEGIRRAAAIREGFSELKGLIEANSPPSREQSVALTHLETAAMWAIKATVFNDPDSEVS